MFQFTKQKIIGSFTTQQRTPIRFPVLYTAYTKMKEQISKIFF